MSLGDTSLHNSRSCCQFDNHKMTKVGMDRMTKVGMDVNLTLCTIAEGAGSPNYSVCFPVNIGDILSILN